MLRESGLTYRELRNASSNILDIKLNNSEFEGIDSPPALSLAEIQNRITEKV